MDKNLKEKAIDFKGKKYVLVADRVLYFNETYDKGCICTDMVKYENKQIIIKASVYPEGLQGRVFTGYSQAIEDNGYINKTSALENAETSAVGRALAMMGIGVIESIASIDEINKATNREKTMKSDVIYKDEFTEKNLDDFIKIKDKYFDYMQAIEVIESKYKVSKEMDKKVRDLYGM